jgi:hypothetical protein
MNHNDQEAMAFIAIMAVFVGAVIVVSVAIHAVLCWFVSKLLKRVPKQYRKQEPGMVWLMMIPCFNFVWSFFVYPKLAESYKAYFIAQGRPDVDCGESLAMAYCILLCCSIIPYVNALTGTAGLVVLILFLVKINDLKNQIPADATMV